MARHVYDLQMLFRVIGDHQSSSAYYEMKGLRVAWYTEDGIAPVTEETRGAVKAAVIALSEAGLLTEERRVPHMERGHDLWMKLFSRASVVQLREAYTGREKEAGGFVKWRLATADDSPTPTLDDYIATWMERDRLRVELLEWMETTPLIVAPVGATHAIKHDEHRVNVAGSSVSVFRAFSYSQTFNVFDLPVVTVPAGRSSDGFPIGVQIIGRPFAEEMVLAAAAIVETALGGWQMPAII
jgi:amidase